MLPIAILAGGKATRLGDMARKTPKSMIAINGIPFIAWQLKLLKNAGYDRAVICVGHLENQIRDYIGDGSHFGLTIDYSADGDTTLGTGGAIKKALPKLGDVFAIIYGDSFLPINYRSVESAFLSAGTRGLMTVYRNEDSKHTNNIEFHNGRVKKYSKEDIAQGMKHIDFGLNYLTSRSFQDFPGDENFDLGHIFDVLAQANDLSGFEVSATFHEIGSTDGINELSRYLDQERNDLL